MPYLKTFDYKGIKIHVVAEDFKDIMNSVVKNLQMAKFYVANENQRKMIEAYIEHFTYGEYDLS